MSSLFQPHRLSGCTSLCFHLRMNSVDRLRRFGPTRDGDALSTWNASYTGSPTWPTGGADSSSPQGVGYRRTQYSSANFQISFEGTALWLCLRANGAGYHLSVDGAAQNTIGTVEDLCRNYMGGGADLVPDTVLVSEGLEPGRHTGWLQVSASPQNEFRFWGGGVVMRLQTSGHVIQEDVVDDRATGWLLNPSNGNQAWSQNLTSPTLYSNTATTNCVYGAGITASYTFSNAAGVILRGSAWESSKAFAVQLDNQITGMYATTSWFDGSAVFFAAGSLDPSRSHTLTLINYNSEDPECPSHRGGQCCIGVDSIVVLRASTEILSGDVNNTHVTGTGTLTSGTVSGTPTQSVQPIQKGPANLGMIVGAAVGGVAALLAGIILMFCLLRRQRRKPKKPVRDPPLSLEERTALRPWAQVDSSSHPGSPTAVIVPYHPPLLNNDSSSSLHPPNIPYTDRKTAPSLSAPTISLSEPPSSVRPRSDHDGSSGYETVVFSDDSAPQPSARPLPTTPSVGTRLTNEELDHVLTLLAQRIDQRHSPLRQSFAHSAEETLESDLPAYREPEHR
ncbi:hypothetical protein BKA62DRAFT_433490 [Auriculariales sp. MPI-PUGE-AT-0066]|nr:hypothetical protein BKA62DRAFT_433490 [Auriculariales sp. MPI-PUGE-AT-0066]